MPPGIGMESRKRDRRESGAHARKRARAPGGTRHDSPTSRPSNRQANTDHTARPNTHRATGFGRSGPMPVSGVNSRAQQRASSPSRRSPWHTLSAHTARATAGGRSGPTAVPIRPTNSKSRKSTFLRAPVTCPARNPKNSHFRANPTNASLSATRPARRFPFVRAPVTQTHICRGRARGVLRSRGTTGRRTARARVRLDRPAK